MTKQTMTVGELIAKLQQYSSDLRVVMTWEGVTATLYDEVFSIQNVNEHVRTPNNTWSLVDAGKFLVIDAEGNTI
jgi:hypothetical protein